MAEPLYVFAGHHKCLSTFLRQVLAAAAERLGWKVGVFHRHDQYGSDLNAWLRRHPVDLLILTNADREHLRAVAAQRPLRGLHVVRDPRDVIVSAYHSHRSTHTEEEWPRLMEHRRRLRELGEKEGLQAEMEFSKPNLERMERWAGRPVPGLYEVLAERIMVAPYDTLLAIFRETGLVAEGGDIAIPGLRDQVGRRWLGLRRPCLTTGEALALCQRYGFRALSGGRQPGEEDAKSHYRRGVPGDWRRAFGPAEVERFHALFGDLPQRLGYPQS